jgi:hypothetical protein
MPQEHKAWPTGSTGPASNEERGALEGWVPTLASEPELRDALDKAFDYRGDVSITLRDGSNVEGYIFDRRGGTHAPLAQCQVRLFPKDRDERVAIAYSDIARLEFTGRDTAAGKSFETWLKKYNEKKATQQPAR